MKNIFSFIERFLNYQDRYYSVLTDKATFGPQGMWGSKDNPLVDPNTMASVAGVITPNYPITVVSGALAITGITVPYADFAGRITFLPTGAFTWTNATNIALAGTAVVGKALDFTYNPVTNKWYPSYIA